MAGEERREIYLRTFLERKRFAQANEFMVPGMEWTQYESPYESYRYYFSGLVDLDQELLARGDVVMMDAMAPGRAIRDLCEEGRLRGGLSVTLNDFRKEAEVENDADIGAEVLAGHLWSGVTMRKIDDWIATTRPEKPCFDIITCCVGLGFSTMELGALTYPLFERLYWRAVSLLSPDGGLFVTDLPIRSLDDYRFYYLWANRINGANVGLQLWINHSYDHESTTKVLASRVKSIYGRQYRDRDFYRRFSRGIPF